MHLKNENRSIIFRIGCGNNVVVYFNLSQTRQPEVTYVTGHQINSIFLCRETNF